MAKTAPQSARPKDRYPLVEVLAPDGRVVGDLPDLPEERMLDLYRRMIVTRVFDQRALSLQRQGRIGTYAPVNGQEAAQVASALALEPDEWMFPTYRDYGAMYTHGASLRNLILFPMGYPDGVRVPEGVGMHAVSISIATHVPHAVGAAWASKLKGEHKAFIAYHGDGATSEGDFHEGMNLAGVFQVPLVVVCQNNGWAISVPRTHQTASETLAQKADAYGIRGILVDGNDALAVYRVVSEALDQARHGEGPTFVEALTYRLGPHTTADDPTRYRDREELERMQTLDPVVRMKLFLASRNRLDEKADEAIWEEARAEVSEAVREAEATPTPKADFFFDHVFADLTPRMARQRARFRPEEGEE